MAMGRFAPFLLATVTALAAVTACATSDPTAGGATPAPSTAVPGRSTPAGTALPATPSADGRKPLRWDGGAHDYNGDGYADLTVGLPEGTAGGIEEAGRVEAVYGSPGGVTTRDRRIISRGSAAVRGERFGATLASGDFDRDGYADLAIGAPGKGGRTGSVVIAFGAGRGLSGETATLGKPPSTKGFGAGLAVGDFDRDGYHDLAVASFSAVWVTYGHDGVRSGRAEWRPVLPETADVGPLAAGDVTGDGFADLAVVYSEDDPADEGTGVVFRGSRTGLSDRVEGTFPGWGVGAVAVGDVDGDGHGDVIAGNSHADAEDPGGQIYVSRGSATGLAGEHTLWTRGSPGMPPGRPEAVDGFGDAVAAGDVDGDGYADVAVGAGGQVGAAFLLYGGRDGLSAKGAQVFGPESAGRPAESAQGFGREVALTDLDGDGRAELAVSAGDGGGMTVLSPGGKGAGTRLTPERPDESLSGPLN